MILDRFITARVLLSVALFLTGGCSKNPQTSKTPTILGVPVAMKIFYGNYDAETQSSRASLQVGVEPISDKASEQQAVVRPFFHVLTKEAGVEKFFLLTYAAPRAGDFDCHACAPTIGMAIFSEKRGIWSIESSNKRVTQSGGWGQPSHEIGLVKIGPEHMALQVKDAGGGQGETTVVTSILVPWNGTVVLGLDRILADDDAGGCDPEGVPCYANHRNLEFLPKDNTDYYDLAVRLTGTDLSDSIPPRVRAVNASELLKFENGRYVRSSFKGDVTSADRFREVGRP